MHTDDLVTLARSGCVAKASYFVRRFAVRSYFSVAEFFEKHSLSATFQHNLWLAMSERGTQSSRNLFLLVLQVVFRVIFYDTPVSFYQWLTRKKKNVKGQVVVITGAASGMGLEMARRFALEHEAKVVLLDLNKVTRFCGCYLHFHMQVSLVPPAYRILPAGFLFKTHCLFQFLFVSCFLIVLRSHWIY